MKQKIVLLFTYIGIVLSTSSCIFELNSIKGNGDVVEETRTVDAFDQIKVSRGMNVYISQGDEVKVVVKADKNLLEVIETRNEGDALKVTASANIKKATSKKVYITTPNIDVIKTFAGSNVFSQTNIKTDNLELSCSAGSNLKLEVYAKNIEVSASSGSNIKLDGKAKMVTAKASAGSNIKAEKLSADNCNLKASSGSNIWISTINDFEAHATSGGNIFYYGTPKTTDITKSLGGNVIAKR